MSAAIEIARIETIRLKAEVSGLPTSSLGRMQDRNGLLIRIEAPDGAFGWGEIWCNFPPHASLSRQLLLANVIGPGLIGKSFPGPGDVRPALETRWMAMATHVGEPGPFGHCMAGIDMAAWDMAARRAGMPLCKFLATDAGHEVNVYASAVNPDKAPQLAAELAAAGHNAFKLKVGYDLDRDQALVGSVREATGSSAAIMIDANQSWTLPEAREAIDRLAKFDLTFVEEPISALAPLSDWAKLAEEAAVPLAAGENICSDELYARHIETGALQFYQPDVAKWGGIGGCASVARRVIDTGSNYCPHFMGTGLGLAASIHLLAATGGSGYVELDANENPLRTDLCDLDLSVSEGRLAVPQGVGIGVIPDEAAISHFQVTN